MKNNEITVKGIIWNKETVIEYLEERQDFLFRAIVQIYERQNDNEQDLKQVMTTNGRGFTKGDAKFLSKLAELIIIKQTVWINDKEILEAKKRMKKYANQLLIVIKEKNV